MATKKPENPIPSEFEGLPPELHHLVQGTDPEVAQGGIPDGEIPPPAPEPTPAPADPAEPFMGEKGFAFFASIMKELVGGLTAAQMTPQAMKEILLETGKVNAELAKKAKWPENATHLNISAYFTADDLAKYGSLENKPKLLRETYFCGTKEEEDRLTPAEIEAYNAITKPVDVRGGAWRAEIIKPKSVGAKEVLHVYVPKETVDQRMVLPSLLLILHELNGGPSTENVYQLMKQLETMKALLLAKGMSVADLEGTLAGVK